MGEIAEMMLDGTLCQHCGVLLDDSGDAAGYPMSCSGCGGGSSHGQSGGSALSNKQKRKRGFKRNNYGRARSSTHG